MEIARSVVLFASTENMALSDEGWTMQHILANRRHSEVYTSLLRRRGGVLRIVLISVFVAVAYYCGIKFAFAVRLPHSNFSPAWPPVAILLAALLLTPTRTWWFWLLVSVPVHLAIYVPLGSPLWRQLVQLIHNTLMVLPAAFILRRYAPDAIRLATFRGVLIFLFVVTAVGLIVPLFTTAVYVLMGIATSFWQMWQLITFSNILMYLALLPTILLVFQLSPLAWRISRERWIEAGVLVMAVLLVGEVAFGFQGPNPSSSLYIRAATLPLLLWAAVRFGPLGVSLAITAMTIEALWNAALGYGPFTGMDATTNVLDVPTYFLTFSSPLLLLASLMADRRQAEATLRELNAELENRVLLRTAELERTNLALAVARDQAESANVAKSQFLATMSHELRTPLHAILGYNQILLNSSSLSLSHRGYGQAIQRSADHLLTLITNVLDFGTLEAGQTTLAESPTNLASLLDSIVETFQLRASHKGLLLRSDVAGNVPQTVMIDAVKLRQVLNNLVGNAVKYTARGMVLLTVSCEERTEQDDPTKATLVLAVSDTGPGIPDDEQQQMFQPFVQTKAGIEAGEGTGLGLAICQQFVTLMGGTLAVRSTLGHGSIFTVRLPVLVITAAMKELEIGVSATSAQPSLPVDVGQLFLSSLSLAQLAILERVCIEGNPGQITAVISDIQSYAPDTAAMLQVYAKQIAFDIILESVRTAQKAKLRDDPA